MKICVMGYSGSGKSTLASFLARLWRQPALHLDQVQFTAGWRERDRAEALDIVTRFMEARDWVIDGNYTGFLQKERLEQADLIVFLDFRRLSCLWRVLRRRPRFAGRTRDSMAPGREEKVDFAFILWILWKQRAKEPGHFRSIIDTYRPKTVVLKNQRQLDDFMAAALAAKTPEALKPGDRRLRPEPGGRRRGGPVQPR